MPTQRYEKVCKGIANCVNKEPDSCPKHSTPIVVVDNNSDYARTPYCEEAVGPFSNNKTFVSVEGGVGKVNFAGDEMIEIGSRHKR